MTPADLDRSLLPDEDRWGQGYGGKQYAEHELDEIAHNVAETKQPNYGSRLFCHSMGFERRSYGFVVPGGYDAADHPNRRGVDPASMDPSFPTSRTGVPQTAVELQTYFRGRGWELDQHGRPCHPHADQLLVDGRIGLNTGVGYGYFLGENVVVDAVAVVDGRVLLVRRVTAQGDIPSLVGGYARPADFGVPMARWRSGHRPVTVDGIHAAARRIVLAETGLSIPEDAAMVLVRGVRPVSSPHTLNFWTVTYTVRVDLADASHATLTSRYGARLVPLEQVFEVARQMWSDHRRGLASALDTQP